MQQYKTPEATRRVATGPAGSGNFWPADGSYTGNAARRVKILPDAYYTPLKDPALLEDLKKRRWVVDSIRAKS